jgi:hypothetical protein
MRKAIGTLAAPGRMLTLNVGGATIWGQVYARNAADTADAFVTQGQIQTITESVDAQSRIAGAVRFLTSPASAPVAEVVRLTAAGNLSWADHARHRTDRRAGPRTGTTDHLPADAVQLWAPTAARPPAKEPARAHGRWHVACVWRSQRYRHHAQCHAEGATYPTLSVREPVGGADGLLQERPVSGLTALVHRHRCDRQGRMVLSVYDAVAGRESCAAIPMERATSVFSGGQRGPTGPVPPPPCATTQTSRIASVPHLLISV